MTEHPLCMLMILDGWGIAPDSDSNAVYLSGTPNLNRLKNAYPATKLTCHGEAVGLPDGFMGNSEVGHLNIGAGRIVYQDLLRIDMAIRDGSFFNNEILCEVMDRVTAKGSRLHLIGLVSDGGVHSHIRHLFALLNMASDRNVPETSVYALLDGRDTPPNSGARFVEEVKNHIQQIEYGNIAGVCGRYYAMDRDNRWDRVEKAFRLLVKGEGKAAKDPVQAIQESYENGETDEFVKPVSIVDDSGHPKAVVGKDDGVIFFNFRADRAREITRALTAEDFDQFDRGEFSPIPNYVCMTRYDKTFTLPVAYPKVNLTGITGEVISKAGLKQFRIAETEKYAHVTYFFNGGEETPFPLEDRLLIPSPRDIPTYDYRPAMSAEAVTEAVIERIRSEEDSAIVLNFANMDMVGHTGVLEAAVEACQTVDACVGRIVPEILERGGTVLITADHGNSEKMKEKDGSPHTAHTLNSVPFILVSDGLRDVKLREEGILADIAPTLLDIMGLEKSGEMTGTSLIEKS